MGYRLLGPPLDGIGFGLAQDVLPHLGPEAWSTSPLSFHQRVEREPKRPDAGQGCEVERRAPQPCGAAPFGLPGARGGLG